MPKKIEDIISSSKKRTPSKYFSELARATNKHLEKEIEHAHPHRSVTKEHTHAFIKEDEFGNVEEEVITRKVTREAVDASRTAPRSGKSLVFMVTGALVALVLGISLFISGATITIVPRSATLQLDDTFTAVKDGVGEVLPYEIVAISKEENGTLVSSGSTNVATKATGKVILYNAFSATAQKLLINTRLTATNGKIYMTDTAVAIPGYKKVGTKITPGAVEIAVTAQDAGSGGNTGLTDFTITGFKGTPKAKGFYGRGKTEMTGGAEGERFTATTEELATAQKALGATLQTTIIESLTHEIPEGYVLFPNSVVITEDPTATSINSVTKDIPIKVKATAYAYIFNREKLTEKIAKTLLPDYDKEDVLRISNIDQIIFTGIAPVPKTPTDTTPLTFKLSGTAKFIWDIDVEALKTAVVNTKKSAVLSYLTENRGVLRADVVVRPFWQNKLPKTTTHIEVIIKNPFE